MKELSDLVKLIQDHLTDGLLLVIGSGLSAAEGIPGMDELAAHLSTEAESLTGDDRLLWTRIKKDLDANNGLEAALLKNSTSDALEDWIRRLTCSFLLPAERAIFTSVLNGSRTLRLTSLLKKTIGSKAGIPILTPNYDRLAELACEMAGLHVDTTAVGHYAGEFDHKRSCMGSCKGVTTASRTAVLDHYPRAIILKPHGSFDWYRTGSLPRRCTLDLDIDRLIITPGQTKYRRGYETPFDKHRELANEYVRNAARLLIVGYGFNDDHLQQHLEQKIRDGTPTLIFTHTASNKIIDLASTAPQCYCISKPSGWDGAALLCRHTTVEHQGPNLWDIGTMAQEIL